MLLASSLAVGNEQLPLAIIGLAGGPQVLALFRVALAPARLVGALVSPAGNFLFTSFTREAAKRRLGEVRRQALTWTAPAIPVAILASLVAWAALPALIGLVFGAGYDDAVVAATLLVAAALVRGTVVWSKVIALAVGRPEVRSALLRSKACCSPWGPGSSQHAASPRSLSPTSSSPSSWPASGSILRRG